MAEKIPEIERRRWLLDRALLVLAAVAIIFSALAILIFGGGSPTGFAVSDVPLLTGSQGSDDAQYFSYILSQEGKVDDRALESYERFLALQDRLNYVYASSEMGQMEMSPLEISEAEFSSSSFKERYSPMIGSYNRLADTASEVAAGNKAAEERFLIELYSFGLYLDGASSGTYWRAAELPSYEGLSEVRAKFGEDVYRKVLSGAYGLLLESDPSMPGFDEWA